MPVSVADALIIEHPLMVRRGKIIEPSHDVLRRSGRGMGTAVSVGLIAMPIPCPTLEQAIEVKMWSDDCIPNRYRLAGVWEITEYQFRTDQKFAGLCAYLSIPDAMHLKIAWCEFWKGTF